MIPGASWPSVTPRPVVAPWLFHVPIGVSMPCHEDSSLVTGDRQAGLFSLVSPGCVLWWLLTQKVCEAGSPQAPTQPYSIPLPGSQSLNIRKGVPT